MIFVNTPIVFICLYFFLQPPNEFAVVAEESNDEYLKHLTTALSRKVEALVDIQFANARKEESELIVKTNEYIVNFRNYIFANYDVTSKKVDECVNKAVSIVEDNYYRPTACRQLSVYTKLHDEVISNFSAENIEAKSKEVCKDWEKLKTKDLIQCVVKSYNGIEDKGYGREQIKQKLKSVCKKSEECIQKLKEKYEAAKKQVKNCPKK